MLFRSLNLSADILGNISEEHGIIVDTLDQIGVIPGEEQTVNFTITNSGNLVENIIIETSVSGDWDVSPATQPLTLAVDETHTGTIVVDVPALGDDNTMLDGTIIPVTMRILNATTEDELKVHRFNFIVAPIFIVEVENWPSEKYYHRGYDRTWDVIITNTGNTDIDVDVAYTLLQGGLSLPSTDWEVSNTAPSTLSLKRGVATPFSFTVRAVAPEPALTLAANLIVSITPVDTEIGRAHV